jgi:hypothetical protein
LSLGGAMVHPCRSGLDTGGNPSVKLHNCPEGSKLTTCGLPVSDVNTTYGVTSLCRTCWPSGDAPVEEPWTAESGNEGDRIGGR